MIWIKNHKQFDGYISIKLIVQYIYIYIYTHLLFIIQKLGLIMTNNIEQTYASKR